MAQQRKPGRKPKYLKPPAFQFYTGDWKRDAQLAMCSPATRGVWIEALASMHDNDRSGQLVGTIAELAQTCRCTPEAMVDALRELRAKKAALVLLEGEQPEGLPSLPPDDPHAFSHAETTPETTFEKTSKRLEIGSDFAGVITLINRRMYRDYSVRKWATLRQKQKYSRSLSRPDHALPHSDSPTNLTAPSSSSSSYLLRGSKDPHKRHALTPSSSLPADSPISASTEKASASACSPDMPANLGQSKPAVMALVNKHRETALLVFAELNAARRRIKPRAHLLPRPSNEGKHASLRPAN